MKQYNLYNYVVRNEIEERDKYSDAILKFKRGKSLYVNELTKSAETYAKKNLGKYDYIVRVLGSDELTSNGGKPLDYLCHILSDVTRAKYLRNYLSKREVRDALKGYSSKGDRLSQLENNYYISDDSVDLSNKKVLIVDDICTTGASIETIKRLLLIKNCSIDAFVLGKTSHSEDQDNVAEIGDQFFNIEKEYYDNSEYKDIWKEPGYTKIGFLKSIHEVFPQIWDYDFKTKRDDINREEIICRIFLEESKEFFFFDLCNFNLFDGTEILIYTGETVSFNVDEYFLGVINKEIYFLKNDYKNITREKITASNSQLI